MQDSQILSLDKFLANAHEWVDQLNAASGRVILTKNDNAVAVVQSIKEHQRLLDALMMLKLIVQSEKDIQAGNVRKQKQVFKKLHQRLESKIE